MSYEVQVKDDLLIIEPIGVGYKEDIDINIESFVLPSPKSGYSRHFYNFFNDVFSHFFNTEESKIEYIGLLLDESIDTINGITNSFYDNFKDKVSNYYDKFRLPRVDVNGTILNQNELENIVDQYVRFDLGESLSQGIRKVYHAYNVLSDQSKLVIFDDLVEAQRKYLEISKQQNKPHFVRAKAVNISDAIGQLIDNEIDILNL